MVAIATGATYYYYYKQPPKYRATASVFVKTSLLDQALTSGSLIQNDERNTANQATLLTSHAVARSVARKIGFRGDPGALLGNVQAVARTDKDFVLVKAEQGSAQQAAKLANAFASAFIELRSASSRDRVRGARDAAQAQLDGLTPTRANAAARKLLRDRVRELATALVLPAGGAEIADAAVAPGAPFAPKPVRNAIFACVLALLLAGGGAFVLELFDRRITDISDLEDVYPFPILGVIPEERVIAPIEDGTPVMPHASLESFRSVRTNLDLSTLDRPVKTLLVGSALPSEGKSSVVRNLALIYSHAGKRVAVLEADLRKPTLARVFGLEKSPGLTDMLAGDASLEQALHEVSSESGDVAALTQMGVIAHSRKGAREKAGRLAVITSGPPTSNPPAVLGSERIHELIAHLQQTHDMVIIDTPPLLSVSDAVPLLSAVDAVILVSRLEHTTRAAARRVCDLIGMVPEARVAGVVVNDVAPARMVETGFEYYYYGPRLA